MTTTTERAKELLAGITPGEWEIFCDTETASVISHATGVCIATVHDFQGTQRRAANLAFIAAAPELVRELCAEGEEMRRQRDRLAGHLYAYYAYCPDRRKLRQCEDSRDCKECWLDWAAQEGEE